MSRMITANKKLQKRPPARVKHANCCNICLEKFPDEGTLEACAAKHILAANKDTIGCRFKIQGTKISQIKQASIVACQTAISPHICGTCQPLLPATAKLLGITNSRLKNIVGARGEKTHEQMNSDVITGADTARKIRSDYYDKMRVYNFFHDQDQQVSDLPDYSALVHLDKSKRNPFQNMKWKLFDKDMTLTCCPRYRQATLGMLAIEYLTSETHLRLANVCNFIMFSSSSGVHLSMFLLQLCRTSRKSC